MVANGPGAPAKAVEEKQEYQTYVHWSLSVDPKTSRFDTVCNILWCSMQCILKRIPLEKRPENAQYLPLLKAPDLNSGTECSEVFGCVSGQDVVGS